MPECDSLALINATSEGDLGTVANLLEKGVDVNTAKNDGTTALMIAAYKGYTKIAEALIYKGADVNVRDKTGFTILMNLAHSFSQMTDIETIFKDFAEIFAADFAIGSQIDHLKILKVLLDNGADVNGKTDDGWTALMEASIKGSPGMLKLLIENGADVNAKDNKNGKSALLLIANMNFDLFQSHKEVFRILIDNGAETGISEKDINSKLIYAARAGDIESARFAINIKADVNTKDNNSWTALMCAAAKGSSSIVEMLANNGADVNEKEDNGITALMLAATENSIKTVKILLDKGANVNAKNRNGMSAFVAAQKSGHTEIANLLRMHSKKWWQIWK